MDQPQITPGSNGYQATVAIPDYGPNPWAGQVQGDSAYASQQTAQSQQALGAAQQTMTNYSNATAPYPTYPNSAGVGSQNAFGSAPPQAASPAPATPTISGDGMLGTTTSSGFNPWSLKGEALAR